MAKKEIYFWRNELIGKQFKFAYTSPSHVHSILLFTAKHLNKAKISFSVTYGDF